MTGRVEATAPMARTEDLPGWELVGPGLADLAAGRETIPGELVREASGRLRELGFNVPIDRPADGSNRLYELVVRDVGDRRAHGRYNALRRRLLSFLRAAPHARTD